MKKDSLGPCAPRVALLVATGLFVSAVGVGCHLVAGLGDFGNAPPDGGGGALPDGGASSGGGGGMGGGASGTGGQGGEDPCGDLGTDPLNCGTCGHDCLGGNCFGGQCEPLEVAVDPTMVSFALRKDGNDVTTEIFWITNGVGAGAGKVMRRNLALPTATEFASGLCNPTAIQADSTFVTWSTAGCNDGDGEVVVHDVDAGIIEASFGAQTGPADVARDATGVYWVNRTGKAVMKSQNGMAVNVVNTSYEPIALTVDGTSIYWIEATGAGTANIWRSLKNGVNAAQVEQAQPGASSIVSSVAGVYWTNTGGNQVIFFDGSTPTLIAIGSFKPMGLTVDENHAYWAENGIGEIRRSPLGSLQPEEVETVTTVKIPPRKVAVDTVSIFWMDDDGRIFRLAR